MKYLELERRHAESLSSVPGSIPLTSAPTSAPAYLSPSISLAEKVLNVVELHAKEVEEGVRRQVEGKVRTEVEALQARVDLLCEELHREHRWIRTLEESLQTHNITFPPYPRNKYMS